MVLGFFGSRNIFHLCKNHCVPTFPKYASSYRVQFSHFNQIYGVAWGEREREVWKWGSHDKLLINFQCQPPQCKSSHNCIPSFLKPDLNANLPGHPFWIRRNSAQHLEQVHVQCTDVILHVADLCVPFLTDAGVSIAE